ncbi:glycosyltransferase [Aeromonas veronii]|uniref:glycosyltransferase n=1 Tax=Aeromonas veronii TaxID=654 RepID=UPI0019346C1C|nr:glycosyltransferase [Aeromonas veronii]MBM0415983.1 glycosyltransferase [Aeromonas veronii]MBW3789165.1 glycosyltransferase family 4 protein [Aeromonas veronii]
MNRCIIVSNAVSDALRDERNISTDSPAATRKVFMWANVIRSRNVRSYVLSLGRGKSNGTWQYHKAKVERKNGVVTIYLPFCHIPFVSELITIFTLPYFFLKLWKKNKSAFIYYNRMPAYIFSVILGCYLGATQFIDLEDGEVDDGRASIKRKLERIIPALFDKCCQSGAFLACSSLSTYTKIRRVKNYYGVIDEEYEAARVVCKDEKIRVLFSGTLTDATGASRLVSVIRRMRENYYDWMDSLEFSICGMGDSLSDFRELESSSQAPAVRVYGRLNNVEYSKLLVTSDIGLSLKPVGGIYADTTFPSKVVEYSSNKLLVIATDISDVKSVLGQDGACYLKGNDTDELINCLKRLVDNRELIDTIAMRGTLSLREKMGKTSVRREMERFIFGE